MEEKQEVTEDLLDKWCQQLDKTNTDDLITTLQDISNKYRFVSSQADKKLQEKLRQLICRSKCERSAKQVLLTSSLRTYFHILHRGSVVDTFFQDLDANPNDAPFVLYAMLSSDYHKCLKEDYLQKKCLTALSRAIDSNFSHLVPVLRALNLLCKKYRVSTLDIPLETFYSCLQSNRLGARDEALVLFRYCTMSLRETVKLFGLIINYWPWTNKNKFYLLSVILTNHKFQSLSERYQFDVEDFFNGLRMGLSYKSTFSASQSLVRALSKQHNHQLMDLSIEILKNGTEREIVNFHTQWFSHISQKDELYRMLQLQELREVSFRYIFLVHMFSKQIIVTSKKAFNQLATFLHNSCYQLTMETQMCVFKFSVDNLSSLEFPSCLEFLSDFIEMHRCTECPQIRHTILGKFPIIFNFIAKVFCALESDSYPPVRAFFRRLFQMIIRDMQTATLYQPLIFSLKTMDRVLQILFSSSSKNVSKACKLDQNQKLGEYLMDEKIFDVYVVSRTAFEVLNSPECYDDARELVVNIIKRLKVQSLRDASRRCGECSESIEIDEVAQCPIFARLCIQCSSYNGKKGYSRELLIYSIRRVRDISRCLEKDPLFVCKNEGHIFGHVSVINEVLREEKSSLGVRYEKLLKIVENVITLHLRLLNAAAKEGNTAANFQVMDESLQILVARSMFDRKPDDECRKFLMLSFWMALKTSCEVATTIGSILMNQAEADTKVLKIVEKCLNTSVTVLLRCRHKGAIEASGVSLGKLTKLLTAHGEDSNCYGVVYKCLNLLFENVNQISTTRRGAGLTIMFLHLVKNEVHKERPLTHRAIKMLLSRIENADELTTSAKVPTSSHDTSEQNFDSVHALVLHYLCVIVKDTEIRDTVSRYYDEIMMAAIIRIDNPEWTICNAALQLFGALVPKIVGQKQATEMVEPVCWEPTEVTFLEVTLKLPQTCEHILNTCRNDGKPKNISTRKLILFLEFLSNVEHLSKGEGSISPTLDRFRELFWSLLSHECEKVRKLAATCFVRAHEFREDLPVVLLQMAEIIFNIQNENFFQGILFAINEGIHKIDVEWKHTSAQSVDEFLEFLRNTFRKSYKYRPLSFYTRALLVDFFLLTGLDLTEHMVNEIVQKEQEINEAKTKSIGFDLWQEKVLEHKA